MAGPFDPRQHTRLSVARIDVPPEERLVAADLDSVAVTAGEAEGVSALGMCQRDDGDELLRARIECERHDTNRSVLDPIRSSENLEPVERIEHELTIGHLGCGEQGFS